MNKYTIEEILVGSEYRSTNNRLHHGTIVSAEPRHSAGCDAYLVAYRSPYSLNLGYATIEVAK